MTWLEALSEIYDKNEEKVGIEEDNNCMLLPVAHLTVQAEIQITIDSEGCFITAEKVDKSNAVTVIPVTEDSASRSNGVVPMPLSDKLQYVAGDYDELCSPKKKCIEFYSTYINNLKNWINYGAPKKVMAIYQYLLKQTVMHDLIRTGVYSQTELSNMSDEKKPNGFTRFIVIDKSLNANETRTWRDEEISNSFIQYYLATKIEMDIDYATGELMPRTEKLPAKIRNTGDKAKIISSNDTSGYTFRGRFKEANNASCVGYLTSQKAFNALRWLIDRQGYKNDSEVIVCWTDNGTRTPDILPSSSDDLFTDLNTGEIVPIEKQCNLGERYAKRVNKAIAGYRTDIHRNTTVYVMSLDTADSSNQGRLAITYYDEQNGIQFLDNIERWYTECAWDQQKWSKDSKIPKYDIGTPTPADIVKCAYGVEREKYLDVDSKIKKSAIHRILPCITKHRKFPKDIMLKTVENVSNPLKYTDMHWNGMLLVASALVRKVYIDTGKGVYDMALDTNSMDRSYLFGRLLAVTNQIEKTVLYRMEVSRNTNAKKYWSAFVKRPAKAWSVIYDRIQPYFAKLDGKTAEFYSKQIEEILGKLESVNGFTNDPLKEVYLLGYYSQEASYRILTKEKENA